MKIVLNQPYSFCQLGGREDQEDARFPDEDEPQDWQPFFVVCDGVGGEENGELASRTVCDAFARSLSSADWSEDFTNEDFKRCLNSAYSALDKKSTGGNDGMATTMTFVAFHAGGCTAAHIGDSRIYHVRPGDGILYRSDDHSLVNALVHSGVVSPDEAIGHSKGNVITRCMEAKSIDGERSDATVLRITDIRKGDYFILCTDGVLCRVPDDRLVGMLDDKGLSDKEKCGMIASLCADSADNNTLYMVSVKDVETDDDVEDLDADDDASTVHIRWSEDVAKEVAADADMSVVGKIRNFIGNIFKSRNDRGDAIH